MGETNYWHNFQILQERGQSRFCESARGKVAESLNLQGELGKVIHNSQHVRRVV